MTIFSMMYAIVALVALRVFIVLFLRSKPRLTNSPRKALVVLGSGGHTAEMLQLLGAVDRDRLSPRCYVLANTDAGSTSLAKDFEGNRSDYSFVTIRRSRAVGDSLRASCKSTFRASIEALLAVWRIWPDIILCNGPGTCVPVCGAAFIYRLFCIKDIPLIYVESFARVNNLSLTGMLLYPLVDRFFVMWPDLAQKRWLGVFRRKMDIVTLLPKAATSAPREIHLNRGKKVFVTVGSTKFDDLVRAVDSAGTLRALQTINCGQLVVQYGEGTYTPTFAATPSESVMDCFAFRFKPSVDEDVATSDLVICHAGSGSVLQALKHRKRCIVVPNESLMDNHQMQLADVLAEQGIVTRSSPRSLATSIRTLSVSASPRLDAPDLSPFVSAVNEEAGIISR